MNIDPSEIVYFEWGFVRITATLVFAWITTAVIVTGAYFLTRNLSSDAKISRKQNAVEALFTMIHGQINEISQGSSGRILPFAGTLFLFILASVLLSLIPGFLSPSGSLNTTIALALCVFFAVPFYGISSQGLKGYLKDYLKPTWIMLPFNIISEISRAVSMAIRLYGNVMSSSIIVGILVTIVPLLFPVALQLLGLLTGVIQAYIFAVLAVVYISAAIRNKEESTSESE
ncbi:F0F1 ATP synthase subunit A [Proteiniclasticum sp. SCR006]|uniref:ATP synthase subunit a n=1 Tax=Proteiniclasticum aestuarii TaxID=2817862 RepID=A0A939HCQ9_9CLOT|nr:F0F1 ATP synthase subunit A [Proteiniclasticum aestuarii]MBO1265556.1 F0F1 ATP synthase subunit A [Proteiniclasticum aestuarii]